jgi:hypothetical protein
MGRFIIVAFMGCMFWASTSLAAIQPGLNSRWVEVDLAHNPNSLTEALDLLAQGSSAPGFIREVTVMRNRVDSADLTDFGALTPIDFDPVPLPGTDPIFAVEFFGFINLPADGSYDFSMRHDDGFRLQIGGANIMEFPLDTGPRTTATSVVLSAGVQSFSVVSWEQGGAYINELAWRPPGATEFSIPDEAVFQKNVIPEPASVLVWVCLGLLGAATWRRRKHAA